MLYFGLVTEVLLYCEIFIFRYIPTNSTFICNNIVHFAVPSSKLKQRY